MLSMEVKIEKETDKEVEIVFKDKDKETIPTLLCWELNKDDRIEFAGYKILHPLRDEVKIVIKAKEGNVKKIIDETIGKITKLVDDFLEAWSKRE